MSPRSLLFALILDAAALGQGTFEDLSFDEAAAKAMANGKLLLVDFTATWWPPCKQMERLTWPDEAVLAWITNYAVAIQVDVDENDEIQEQFGVRAMPTMIFLRDGQELDRHTGFCDAASFLAWADGVLHSRIAVEPPAQDLSELAARRDARGRLDYADALVDQRRFDEATQAFRAAWDQCGREPSMAGVRFSSLLSEMVSLGKRHPPARAAFLKLLNESELRAFERDPPRATDFREWVELCDRFGKEARVLSWFEQTRDANGLLFGSRFDPSADPQEMMIRMEMDQFLIEQRRFEDAARLFEEPFRHALQMSFSMKLAKASSTPIAGLFSTDSVSRDELLQTVTERRYLLIARIHAVTLAAGRPEAAARIAQLLLAEDNEGLGRVALVKASLDLEAPMPPDAARWLDEAEDLGAEIVKVRSRLTRAAAPAAKQISPAPSGN